MESGFRSHTDLQQANLLEKNVITVVSLRIVGDFSQQLF